MFPGPFPGGFHVPQNADGMPAMIASTPLGTHRNLLKSSNFLKEKLLSGR